MSPLKNRVIAIIFILLLTITALSGCTLFDNSEEEEKPKGFALETLEESIPSTNSLEQPVMDPKPVLNTSIPKQVTNFIASWYFEKNVVYNDFGGICKVSFQNNGTDRLYIYRIGLRPSWSIEDYAGPSENGNVYVEVGKYINASVKKEVGILYFPGPSRRGEYDYNMIFSIYSQNSSGSWNDCGDQQGTTKTIEVTNLPSAIQYKQHYNLRQYYEKINEVVDPTSDKVINLSRKLAGKYSGPFNIYQVCAIYDYISTNVKYISDPSNTENYWCTPDQTLEFGGDCEDFSTLFASMLISIGGAVRMYLTDSHAFLALYIGNVSEITAITERIQNYYHSNIHIFWLEDELGCWLILDTIGSIYPGGLSLGAGPIMKRYETTLDTYHWTWDFFETENLYIVDVKP